MLRHLYVYLCLLCLEYANAQTCAISTAGSTCDYCVNENIINIGTSQTTSQTTNVGYNSSPGESVDNDSRSPIALQGLYHHSFSGRCGLTSACQAPPTPTPTPTNFPNNCFYCVSGLMSSHRTPNTAGGYVANNPGGGAGIYAYYIPAAGVYSVTATARNSNGGQGCMYLYARGVTSQTATPTPTPSLNYNPSTDSGVSIYATSCSDAAFSVVSINRNLAFSANWAGNGRGIVRMGHNGLLNDNDVFTTFTITRVA